MFNVNQYFDGKVASLAYSTPEGPATIGVMEKGEYEFGTSNVEYMTVISGVMDVMLPGESQWKSYNEFETFIVPKDVKFKVRMATDVAYRCYYR